MSFDTPCHTSFSLFKSSRRSLKIVYFIVHEFHIAAIFTIDFNSDRLNVETNGKRMVWCHTEQITLSFGLWYHALYGMV